jgi:hypothetical protein
VHQLSVLLELSFKGFRVFIAAGAMAFAPGFENRLRAKNTVGLDRNISKPFGHAKEWLLHFNSLPHPQVLAFLCDLCGFSLRALRFKAFALATAKKAFDREVREEKSAKIAKKILLDNRRAAYFAIHWSR